MNSTMDEYYKNRNLELVTQIDNIHLKYAQICGVSRAMLKGASPESGDVEMVANWLEWAFKVPEDNFKNDKHIQHYKYFRKMHDIYKQLNISDQTFCEWMNEHDYNQILKTSI